MQAGSTAKLTRNGGGFVKATFAVSVLLFAALWTMVTLLT